jgi:hypothetical protein
MMKARRREPAGLVLFARAQVRTSATTCVLTGRHIARPKAYDQLTGAVQDKLAVVGVPLAASIGRGRRDAGDPS